MNTGLQRRMDWRAPHQLEKGISARRLSPEGGGHETVCQEGHYASKGVDFRVPHQLKKGTSASEDAGLRSGWIVRFYIGWKGDRNIPRKGVETSL